MPEETTLERILRKPEERRKQRIKEKRETTLEKILLEGTEKET